MKEILKQCILVRGVLVAVDYIKLLIFAPGQVVRQRGEDTNETAPVPVAPKVRVKYKKRKNEEAVVVEEAPAEKPKRKKKI